MNTFDHKGDLWLDVDINASAHVPGLVSMISTSHHIGNGTYCAVTQMNLTEYIRQLTQKD